MYSALEMVDMLVETRRKMPITRLQRELTRGVSVISETGEPICIVKNNTMEAVMAPFEKYEYLAALEEMFEYYEIDDVVQKRSGAYDPRKNIRWSELRED